VSIGAINLSRFQDPRTLDYLRGNGFNLPLYSISGNRTDSSQGTLTANSSFTLPENRFTSAYGVNVNANRTLESTPYYGTQLNDHGQRVTTVSVDNLTEFTTPIQLAGRGKLEQTTIPSTTPSSPEKYRDQLQYYEISDLNFDILRALPDFPIPRNGQGFRVYTNPDGSINRIETDLSNQSRQQTFGATSDRFILFDESKISRGAAFKLTAIETLNQLDRPAAPNPLNVAKSVNPNTATPVVTNPKLDVSLFGADRLNANLALTPNDTLNNPLSAALFQRLQQLQPLDAGLVFTGPEAPSFQPETIQALAANRANVGVSFSQSGDETLQTIQKNSQQLGDVYTHTQKGMAELSARMPMVAVLPSTSRSGNDGGLFGTLNNLGNAMGGMVDDATSKKSSGGYIPFRMGTGGETMGGAMAGGGFAFGGGLTGGESSMGGFGPSADQQEQKRKRFLLQA